MARRTRQRFEVTIIKNGARKVHTVEALCPTHALYESDVHKQIGAYDLYPGWQTTLPVGKTFKKSLECSVEVKCIGPVAKRTYTPAERETRRKEREAREAAKEEERNARAAALAHSVACNRQRIIDQIDHAFLTKTQDAGPFITCDHCSDKASTLILVRPIEGTMLPFDLVAGAICDTHNFQVTYYKKPFVKVAALEFFYDGMKQIYINKGMKTAA